MKIRTQQTAQVELERTDVLSVDVFIDLAREGKVSIGQEYLIQHSKGELLSFPFSVTLRERVIHVGNLADLCSKIITQASTSKRTPVNESGALNLIYSIHGGYVTG